MRRLLIAAVSVVSVLAAAPVWAEAPMTPGRTFPTKPTSPPKAAPQAAEPQWVEPPAASATEGQATAEKPAAPETPAVAAAEPPPAAPAEARPERPARRTAQAGSSANRLNRRELTRVRTGRPTYYYGPYYGAYGYGPSPNASYGD